MATAEKRSVDVGQPRTLSAAPSTTSPVAYEEEIMYGVHGDVPFHHDNNNKDDDNNDDNGGGAEMSSTISFSSGMLAEAAEAGAEACDGCEGHVAMGEAHLNAFQQAAMNGYIAPLPLFPMLPPQSLLPLPPAAQAPPPPPPMMMMMGGGRGGDGVPFRKVRMVGEPINARATPPSAMTPVVPAVMPLDVDEDGEFEFVPPYSPSSSSDDIRSVYSSSSSSSSSTSSTPNNNNNTNSDGDSSVSITSWTETNLATFMAARNSPTYQLRRVNDAARREKRYNTRSDGTIVRLGGAQLPSIAGGRSSNHKAGSHKHGSASHTTRHQASLRRSADATAAARGSMSAMAGRVGSAPSPGSRGRYGGSLGSVEGGGEGNDREEMAHMGYGSPGSISSAMGLQRKSSTLTLRSNIVPYQKASKHHHHHHHSNSSNKKGLREAGFDEGETSMGSLPLLTRISSRNSITKKILDRHESNRAKMREYLANRSSSPEQGSDAEAAAMERELALADLQSRSMHRPFQQRGQSETDKEREQRLYAMYKDMRRNAKTRLRRL